MSPDDTRVWMLIADRHGRASAISAADLARETGLSDRLVRRAVKRLIEAHGAPIASSPHPPAGYFIPTELLEIAEALDSLRHRAVSILVRMSRLKRITLRETVDQLLLNIEDAA